MQIIINGRTAALKQGTSFDYVAENRLFTGSDAYSLSIVFPLKGCPQNIEIFGLVYRTDVEPQEPAFDCEIRTRDFSLFGSLTIVGIDESEVKAQFLEGRSSQNFDNPFDKIYINELNLGSYSSYGAGKTPAEAWNPASQNFEAVALPWVNNSSGILHNCAEYADGKYSWSDSAEVRSWQPYLLHITRRICEAVGYTADLSRWEDDVDFKYLIICNTLPAAWDIVGFSRVLPHWTVAEYFEKLELFLGAEFEVDHRAKSVSFAISEEIVESKAPVMLRDVVDEYSAEVSAAEAKCDYIESKNLAYKDCDHNMSKFYSCDWFIRDASRIIYDSMDRLLQAARNTQAGSETGHPGTTGYDARNAVLFARDINTHFILRLKDAEHTGTDDRGMDKYDYKYMLQPLNLFGGRIIDSDPEADSTEIEFVPACIDFTEEKYGFALFLDVSSYAESPTDSTVTVDGVGSSDGTRPDGSPRPESDAATAGYHRIERLLRMGEQEEKAEYFDCIHVGYWNGVVLPGGRLPHPYVEDVIVNDDMTDFYRAPFSLRINDRRSVRASVPYRIDTHRKVQFKFVSRSIPDVRSVFHINGKRYLCEKLTATFTENGMSQLIKGDFYPIVD